MYFVIATLRLVGDSKCGSGLQEIATLTLAMTGLGGSGFEIATLSLVGDIMDYNDLQEIATLAAMVSRMALIPTKNSLPL